MSPPPSPRRRCAGRSPDSSSITHCAACIPARRSPAATWPSSSPPSIPPHHASSAPFLVVLLRYPLWPGWLPDPLLLLKSLHLLSPAPPPLSIGLRSRQPGKTEGQTRNREQPSPDP